MYHRVFPEQAQSIEFEDVSTEYLRHNAHGLESHPGMPKENPTTVSTSFVTDQLIRRPSAGLGDGKSAPATLKRTAFRQWFSTLFDALLSLIPLFFLVIAALCLSLHGQPISPYGDRIREITLLSPTIFPIIYAAILGKALRRIGLFQAERSTTIGTLEQLMGSQSFFTGIERQFGLRRVNVLGVAIVFAWLLSPLGGQASLRLLSTKLLEIPVNATVGFHAFETHDNFTHIVSSELEDYHWPNYGPIFMTALQTARLNLNEPRDIFGLVKVPDITSLGAMRSDAASPSYDWYDVARASSPIYSSLLGNPIADVPQSANVSFLVESSYWEIRCEPFTGNYTLEMQNNTGYDPRPGFQADAIGPSFNFNISGYARGKNQTRFTFDYQTKLSRRVATSAPCSAALRVVESETSCKTGVCEVVRMRNSKRNASVLFDNCESKPGSSIGPDHCLWWSFYQLCTFLPGSDLGPGRSGGVRNSELVEQWMANPRLLRVVQNRDNWYGVNLGTLPTDVFASRLQMVFNTFWESLLGVADRVQNTTSRDNGDEVPYRPWNTTSATGMRYDGEQYVCNKTFAAITIVISGLLFLAASVAGVLGFITKAPDILGYVSTLARDNPYFRQHVPSHMDGMDAARALRDVRVMVGDVHKTDDVGHVAFASTDVGPQRVCSKRTYD